MGYELDSGRELHYTAAAAITNGALVVVGATPGVARTSAVTGDLVNVAISGVFTVAKKASATDGWSQGARLYYVATGGVNKLTSTAAAGKFVGCAAAAAATGATTASVALAGCTPLETTA